MSVLSTPLTVLYKVKLQWHCVIVRAFIGFVDFSCCADFRYVFDYDQLLMFTNGEGIWAKLEVTGKWRRLHNEELYDLDSVPNVIRVIKPRRMRWAVHVARVEETRNACGVLVGKPEGMTPLGRPRCRW